MGVQIDRCSECGGGPVMTLAWERTTEGVVPTKERCHHCGHVSEVGPDERRVVETVSL